MAFEQLQRPGKDQSLSTSTKYEVHQLRPDIWTTENGILFRLLSSPNPSPRSTISKEHLSQLPQSEVIDPQPGVQRGTLPGVRPSTLPDTLSGTPIGSLPGVLPSASQEDSYSAVVDIDRSITSLHSRASAYSLKSCLDTTLECASTNDAGISGERPEINTRTGYIQSRTPSPTAIEQPSEAIESSSKCSHPCSEKDGPTSPVSKCPSEIPEINNTGSLTHSFSNLRNHITQDGPIERKSITKDDCSVQSTGTNHSSVTQCPSRDSFKGRHSGCKSLELSADKFGDADTVCKKSSTLPIEVDIDSIRTKLGQDSSLSPTDSPKVVGSHRLDEVVDRLSMERSVQQSVTSDYFELIKEISRILARYDEIIAPLYCPSPDNHHKLLLQGPRVSKAKKEIKLLKNRYPEYEMILSERQPVMRSADSNLPIYTRPLAMPCYLHKNISTDNSDFCIATVGAFVKDKDSTKEGLIFGVTSAHAILSKDELGRLAQHGPHESFKACTRTICQSLIGRTHMSERLSIAPHNHTPAHVRDSPLVAYNHFIPVSSPGQTSLLPFQKFMSDIAILPVDANRLDQLKFAIKSFGSTQLVNMLSSDKHVHATKQVPVAGYIDINDASDIARLREANVKIIIDGVSSAKLQIQPETFTYNDVVGNGKTNEPDAQCAQWMIAPHIAFTTDVPLMPGQSGSPLMVYDEVSEVLYIIGLLIGKFESTLEWTTDSLYQAMPFGPALKQLMFLYDDHVTNLTPMVGDLPSSSSLEMAATAFTTSPQQSLKAPNAVGECDGDDSVQLIQHLIQLGPVKDYHRVPESMLKMIERLAQQYKVDCCAIYQSPEDPKDLQIIGINANLLSSAISPLLRSRFPNYSISIIEISNPLHHTELAGNNIFHVEKTRNVLDTLGYAMSSVRCGLILSTPPAVCYPTQFYYAVVPAHFVLDGFREHLLETVDFDSIDLIKQKVENDSSHTKYVLHMHNSTYTCDIESFPVYSYRHYCLPDNFEEAYSKFTNDIALLKIDLDHSRDDSLSTHSEVIPFADVESAMTRNITFSMMQAGPSEVTNEIKGIFPLKHHSTLSEMARLRVCVFVGPARGYMVSCGEPLQCERKWTFAIDFVTLDRKFHEGDCGTIVYVQDNRKGNHFYPFGMLIGKSLRQHKCGPEIYRAVVLKQALDEIKVDYGYLISELRTIGGSDALHPHSDTGLGSSMHTSTSQKD